MWCLFSGLLLHPLHIAQDMSSVCLITCSWHPQDLHGHHAECAMSRAPHRGYFVEASCVQSRKGSWFGSRVTVLPEGLVGLALCNIYTYMSMFVQYVCKYKQMCS